MNAYMCHVQAWMLHAYKQVHLHAFKCLHACTCLLVRMHMRCIHKWLKFLQAFNTCTHVWHKCIYAWPMLACVHSRMWSACNHMDNACIICLIANINMHKCMQTTFARQHAYMHAGPPCAKMHASACTYMLKCMNATCAGMHIYGCIHAGVYASTTWNQLHACIKCKHVINAIDLSMLAIMSIYTWHDMYACMICHIMICFTWHYLSCITWRVMFQWQSKMQVSSWSNRLE